MRNKDKKNLDENASNTNYVERIVRLCEPEPYGMFIPISKIRVNLTCLIQTHVRHIF
jgi:hypothetical protein